MKRQYEKWLVAPAFLWPLLFFVAPLVFVVFYSFFKGGLYGEIVCELTLSNYARIGESIYLKIVLDTLAISVIMRKTKTLNLLFQRGERPFGRTHWQFRRWPSIRNLPKSSLTIYPNLK